MATTLTFTNAIVKQVKLSLKGERPEVQVRIEDGDNSANSANISSHKYTTMWIMLRYMKLHSVHIISGTLVTVGFFMNEARSKSTATMNLRVENISPVELDSNDQASKIYSVKHVKNTLALRYAVYSELYKRWEDADTKLFGDVQAF